MKTAKKKRKREPRKKPMNQLERDTAAYFDNMTAEELKAERELEEAVAGAANGVDFDKEP
jgi:hypothetical protein